MESALLGLRARDRVTGFTGVITGVVVYLTGCNQALVVPPVDDNMKMRDAQWFDVQRLAVLTDRERVVIDNGLTPGCDIPAPIR